MRALVRKNSRPYRILKYLFICGGIFVVGVLSPKAGAKMVNELLKLYIKNKKLKKEKFMQDLKRLQSRQLIEYELLPDKKIKIKLTALGKHKVLVYDIDDLKLNKGKWDGKWRLVIFDIPDNYKKDREALRHKLKQLEFYPLQKSVFMTPFPCENEIDFICSVFDIDRNHVLILQIDSFEGSDKLRHYFHL